jgi:uncharacterized protein YbcC (UPF0753/DUF2309 family)
MESRTVILIIDSVAEMERVRIRYLVVIQDVRKVVSNVMAMQVARHNVVGMECVYLRNLMALACRIVDKDKKWQKIMVQI